MNVYKITVCLVGLLLFVGCSNSGNKTSKDTEKQIEDQVDASVNKDLLKEDKAEDVVFYNLFTPVDLDRVIDEKSSYFNAALINSLDNITKYSSSQKIALNIGVYGADLSYLWMFEQNQQAITYLSAIQHLTSRLGIPDNFVELTVKMAQQNSNNLDSLIIVARNAYENTDKYLKVNDRQSASALILLGGWIESLNIALNMYNHPNSKLAGKILSQKYSLTSLINMVQNSQDDLVMSEYLLLMKKLNDSFKVFESKLTPDDVEIDTINKRITIKDSSSITLNPEDLDNIKDLTAKIREHIIS